MDEPNYVVIKDKKLDIYYFGFKNNRPSFTERMTEAYIYEFNEQLDNLYLSEHFYEDLMKINLKLFTEFRMLESLGLKVVLEYFDDKALLLLKAQEQ